VRERDRVQQLAGAFSGWALCPNVVRHQDFIGADVSEPVIVSALAPAVYQQSDAVPGIVGC